MMKFRACSQLYPRFQGVLVERISLQLRKWYWSEQCWRVGGPRIMMGKTLEFQTLHSADFSSFWSFQHMSAELSWCNLEGRRLVGSDFTMTYLCHLINKKSSSQRLNHLRTSLQLLLFQSPGNYLGFRKVTESDHRPGMDFVLPLSKLQSSFVESTSEENNQETHSSFQGQEWGREVIFPEYLGCARHLTHLILSIALGHRSYYPHFTD